MHARTCVCVFVCVRVRVRVSLLAKRICVLLVMCGLFLVIGAFGPQDDYMDADMFDTGATSAAAAGVGVGVGVPVAVGAGPISGGTYLYDPTQQQQAQMGQMPQMAQMPQMVPQMHMQMPPQMQIPQQQLHAQYAEQQVQYGGMPVMRPYQ